MSTENNSPEEMDMKEFLRLMLFKSKTTRKSIALECKVSDQCMGNKFKRGTISVKSLIEIMDAMEDPLTIQTKDGKSYKITK